MSITGVLLAFDGAGFDPGAFGDDGSDGAATCVASVDLGKYWQALSILMTPAPEPMRSIEAPDLLDPVLGGAPFGDDLGYGEPRHLAPTEVRAVHEHLSSTTDADLRSRFDPARFAAAGVYPPIWHEPAEGLWEELSRLAAALRGFYREAALAGHHVVALLE